MEFSGQTIQMEGYAARILENKLRSGKFFPMTFLISAMCELESCTRADRSTQRLKKSFVKDKICLEIINIC